MKLTEAKLKQLIREMISIGDTMDDAPDELNKLSDFILSIPSDPNNESWASESHLNQAKSLAETFMDQYSDFLKQLKFNMQGKINRKYGPSSQSTASQEYRNMVQFFELFE